jgi:hypothetical protein
MTTATDPKPSIDTLLLDVTNAKLKVTPEHFDQLCIDNPDLRLKLTKDGGWSRYRSHCLLWRVMRVFGVRGVGDKVGYGRGFYGTMMIVSSTKRF